MIGKATTADRLHQAADDARRLSESLRLLPVDAGRKMQQAQADDMAESLRAEARAHDRADFAARR